jgi:hypothetical protein
MIHSCLTLLADIDRFQAMRGALKPGKAVDYTSQILWILVIVAAISVAALVVRMLSRRKRQTAYDPLGLFRELSKAHSLDRQQEGMLREVAQSLELEHPSRLFLEPNLFEQVLQEPRFAPWQVGEKREQLEALQDCLFGEALCLDQPVGV